MAQHQNMSREQADRLKGLITSHRRAGQRMLRFHRNMWEAGVKGPITAAQNKRGKRLFEKLEGFRKLLKGKANNVYMHGEDLAESRDLKKIAVAMYLLDFAEEAQRHSIKGNVARDYAVALSTMDIIAKFLDDNYFYKSNAEIAFDFMVLKGSLDFCAELNNMASLDSDAALKKYTPKAQMLVLEGKEASPRVDGTELWDFIRDRLAYLEPKFRDPDESKFKTELREIVEKLLSKKGTKGVRFNYGKTRIEVRASDPKKEKEKKLGQIAEELYYALARDKFLLREVTFQLQDTGKVPKEYMDELNEMVSESRVPRFLIPI
ncbi:hypothetical protein GF412_02080 [Candidatus Micrarchaeota archaeon]|nr:hypothetical protein [Candidatus Micrarchaeota archaeon]MBD3417750.1 hypothetical protein [Candidatus Micrarchaeota archaeon]